MVGAAAQRAAVPGIDQALAAPSAFEPSVWYSIAPDGLVTVNVRFDGFMGTVGVAPGPVETETYYKREAELAAMAGFVLGPQPLDAMPAAAKYKMIIGMASRNIVISAALMSPSARSMRMVSPGSPRTAGVLRVNALATEATSMGTELAEAPPPAAPPAAPRPRRCAT